MATSKPVLRKGRNGLNPIWASTGGDEPDDRDLAIGL
jgi:hypothetical protein